MGAGSRPADCGEPSLSTALMKPVLGSSNLPPAEPPSACATPTLAPAVMPTTNASTATRVTLDMSLSSPVDQVLLPKPRERGQLVPPRAGHLVDARPGVHHRAQPGGAGELVDVVVRPPGEHVRVDLLGGDEHRDSGANGLEPTFVGDVQLDAAAGLVDPLRERRHEVGLAEVHAGQLRRVERLRPAPVDPGRADDLERPRGPTALGQDRALEHAR